MKTTLPLSLPRLGSAILSMCLLGSSGTAQAEDSSAAAAEAPEAATSEGPAPWTPAQWFEGGPDRLENWIELSVGGLITSGSRAQAEQRHGLERGPFGGIENLHWKRELDKKTTLTLDGRALWDQQDYNVALALQREGLGFLRVRYENFRLWTHNVGGYYPPGGTPPVWPENALTLDRGEFLVEAGLTLANLPALTFRYTHRYRDGDKGSTIWGPARPAGEVKGIYPTVHEVDETVDIFELEARHRVKQTEITGGVRYETGDLDHGRRTLLWPGEPLSWSLTDRQETKYDLFGAHAATETWVRTNLFFSTGFLFTRLDSDSAGNRIYGDDFDVGFIPNVPAYRALTGGCQKDEYVLNLNLLATPIRHLTFVPSIRVLRENWGAESAGLGTVGTVGTPFAARSDGDLLDVRERLELRYTGLTNWAFSALGEWTQGEGNLNELGGLSQFVRRATEDERFFQKYAAGVRWYASRRLSVDVGGYYKLNRYEYDHDPARDNTPNQSFNRYPAYLALQEFETWDGNVRLTLRPWSKLTLVSRYEYQLSTIYTRPDRVSGLGGFETSEMTSHILAQNVSWTPWSRLYLQAGINSVWSETHTAASAYTRAVLDAQNNYWTVNFNSGFVLDDKTDLNAGYFYYRADNFEDNAPDGLPLGMSAEEHGVTATLTRRINQNLRFTFRYGFFHYDEEPAGGRNDHEAHVLYSGVQYRF